MNRVVYKRNWPRRKGQKATIICKSWQACSAWSFNYKISKITYGVFLGDQPFDHGSPSCLDGVWKRTWAWKSHWSSGLLLPMALFEWGPSLNKSFCILWFYDSTLVALLIPRVLDWETGALLCGLWQLGSNAVKHLHVVYSPSVKPTEADASGGSLVGDAHLYPSICLHCFPFSFHSLNWKKGRGGKDEEGGHWRVEGAEAPYIIM